MHRLPDGVVAAKGKGDVADPATGFAPGQSFFDLPHRFNELHRIPVVLLNSGCHRQDVHVEDNVFRGKTRFLGQEPVGSSTNLHFPLSIRSLTFLIEGHHDHGGPVPAHFSGLFEERSLALF